MDVGTFSNFYMADPKPKQVASAWQISCAIDAQVNRIERWLKFGHFGKKKRITLHPTRLDYPKALGAMAKIVSLLYAIEKELDRQAEFDALEHVHHAMTDLGVAAAFLFDTVSFDHEFVDWKRLETVFCEKLKPAISALGNSIVECVRVH